MRWTKPSNWRPWPSSTRPAPAKRIRKRDSFWLNWRISCPRPQCGQPEPGGQTLDWRQTAQHLIAQLQEQEQATADSPPLLNRAHHNLPTQTTSFIGREDELTEVQSRLLEESACRLLTLIGPGGTGKTRLALAVAAQLLETFADGVYLVSLAPVSEVDDIVAAVAEALRITFYGNADPKAQLLNYLCQKQMLLLVDNFEHLLDGADLLSDVLRQAANITLLVTSRERLNLQEEWVYEVRGLAFPGAIENDSSALPTYSAVELFMQRARQIAPNFAPTEDELAHIGHICQLVGGMPLGVELAATWSRTLSCREIAAEIERSLDFLSTTLRNLPERHRSLRVIFEQTWERLSEEEQSVLSKLSVFRGGCTREAAEKVTGATLPILSWLADKTLLRRTNVGRYELHELVRQFAAARLADNGNEIATKQKLLLFFVNFAREGEQALYGSPEQLEWLNRLENDHANMRTALDWGLAHDLNNAAALVTANWVYYFRCGHFREAQKTYDFLLEQADQLPDELLARVLNGRCSVALAQGDLEGLALFGNQALDYFQRLEDNFGISLSYHHLAVVSLHRGDYERASQLVELGIDAARNYHWIKAILLHHMANIYESRGEVDRAAETLLNMLSISEQINDVLSALYFRMSLAEIEIRRKNLKQAEKLLLRIQTDAEAYREMQITAWVKEELGLVALASGEAEKAITHIQQCLKIQDSINSGQDRARVLLKLGLAQTEAHHFKQARTVLLSGAELALKDGRPVTLDLLEHLARLDWLERQDPVYLRNLSAAAANRAESQQPLAFPFDVFVNQTIDQMRQAIDAQQFEALWQEGQGLDPVQLLQEILEQSPNT